VRVVVYDTAATRLNGERAKPEGLLARQLDVLALEVTTRCGSVPDVSHARASINGSQDQGALGAL
jgi:hypothetical protein